MISRQTKTLSIFGYHVVSRFSLNIIISLKQTRQRHRNAGHCHCIQSLHHRLLELSVCDRLVYLAGAWPLAFSIVSTLWLFSFAFSQAGPVSIVYTGSDIVDCPVPRVESFFNIAGSGLYLLYIHRLSQVLDFYFHSKLLSFSSDVPVCSETTSFSVTIVSQRNFSLIGYFFMRSQ